MGAKRVHLDVSVGLSRVTACGKSLHGWNLSRPELTSIDRDAVTCLRCLKAAP